MKNCQLKFNMNYEVMVNKNDPLVLLAEIIEKIYEEPNFRSKDYNMSLPEEIMMEILIYGYMNKIYSSREIETSCRRDINFMYLLEEYKAPDHTTIARFRKKMLEQVEKVFIAPPIKPCQQDADRNQKYQGVTPQEYSRIARRDNAEIFDLCQGLLERFNWRSNNKLTEYLLEKGEISGKNIFIDGTKIEANAKRYTFVWQKAVSKNEAKLRNH